MKTHGLSGHKLYPIWKGILSRCNNKNRSAYPNYGGRGIEVTSEWFDAEKFIGWAEANGWRDGLQIDRIDNDLGYFPLNCQFVTAKENAANRRDTIIIIIHDKEVCLAEAARLSGIDESTLRKRIKSGMQANHPLLLHKGRLSRNTIPEMSNE